ncbi:hypothetical protein BC936DRAFT_148095 [Jimgerdemannia flammicorona]|uniref:Uncharacterized protein n=1 Tax=Jimgerdemannia flammicorona TaxID=994334 RepID=A0A433DKU6_9FUNG|nr:hypothetical protein BC936DRAFT_148095 [Jimgerdemannia flammicorona]
MADGGADGMHGSRRSSHRILMNHIRENLISIVTQPSSGLSSLSSRHSANVHRRRCSADIFRYHHSTDIPHRHCADDELDNRLLSGDNGRDGDYP